MISRRNILTYLAVGVLLASRSNQAQQGTTFRIGVLTPGPRTPYRDIFFASLRNAGYTEGKNLVVEARVVAPEDLPSAALELVRTKVDVIFAAASSAVRAAVHVTKETPIVAVDLETDPVASGYVASLARPGTNLTGFFLDLPEFSAKRLEGRAAHFLRRDRALGSVFGSNPTKQNARCGARTEVAGCAEVRVTADLDNAFQAASNRKGQAVMVMQSPALDGYKDEILNLGARYRVPVIAVFANFAADGALLSYGPNAQDMVARAATYVARVLEGAKVTELPIQRPAKFDLIVNARTAKSLGLTIHHSIMVRADEVIW